MLELVQRHQTTLLQSLHQTRVSPPLLPHSPSSAALLGTKPLREESCSVQLGLRSRSISAEVRQRRHRAVTSPSPRGLPKALVATTSLQILTASLLAGLMGKAGLRMIPSAPRASPKVSTHYLLSAPRPYLLRAAHCIQQAGYGCPAEATLVFLGTSTAPLGTALPGSAALHCGALNHWPQPHMPQSQQLEPLHQPPSDGCHLPVANAQVSGSLLTIPQLGQVWPSLEGSHLPSAALGFLGFQSTKHTHAQTHTHVSPPCGCQTAGSGHPA